MSGGFSFLVFKHKSKLSYALHGALARSQYWAGYWKNTKTTAHTGIILGVPNQKTGEPESGANYMPWSSSFLHKSKLYSATKYAHTRGPEQTGFWKSPNSVPQLVLVF